MSTAASAAARFFQALAAAGVRDVIASPGSRSTPFLLAALRCERLKVHSVIDERAAAFIALGQARRWARPTVLLCTSGTAAAHYFPAVIEASRDQVPLLIISADRPADLQGCEAPQTMTQPGLYGHYVRGFIDLGEARAEARAERSVVRQAGRAFALSVGSRPGPVHVNAPARKPLEPVPEPRTSEPLRVHASSVAVAHGLAPDDALQHIADRLASSAHALIVAGPAPAQAQAYRTQLASVAALAEAPVIADTASQQRFGRSADGPVVFDHASVVLRSEEGRQALTPDFILQIGRAPISSAWLKFLSERVDTDLMVLAGERFADVESNARLLVQGDIGEALSRLDAMLSARATDARAEDSGWLAHISRLNDAAAAAIERECAVAAPNSEIKAARAIGAALPDGSHLVLGNSLPIRHFDAFIPGDGRDIRVYSQRGVSGIDGLVAGAAGVALDNESPTWIVLGDVSLVHDLGGLGAACALGIRLRVIVLNNAGGRIFDQLPVAARADLAEAMPFFHTTPQVDFEALVSGLGGTYHRAISDRELEERLRKPGADGVEVIEVMLDPSSAKQGLSRITDACLSTESAG